MQNSIHSKALLVRLGIGMPGNTRTDKKVTDDTIREQGMQEGAGRWKKQLYPEAALEPLTKLVTEARTYHYANTLPWSDEGWRILPTAMHSQYCGKIRQFRYKFEDLAANHFIARMDEWLQWARISHNGTFDASNYPEPEKLRAKFKWDTDVQAIPSAQDFRVDLSNEEVAQLQGNVDQRVQQAVREANKDLWNRLMTPLRCMVERLSDPDHKFKDSLVGNIRDIVGLIPKLNLTGDSNLAHFANEVETTLAGYQPKTLRDDKLVREQAAKRAQEILDKMSSYMA